MDIVYWHVLFLAFLGNLHSLNKEFKKKKRMSPFYSVANHPLIYEQTVNFTLLFGVPVNVRCG